MGERKEKVSDCAAVEAFKTIIAYCESICCAECVFDNYGCYFRRAPIYWTVPMGYEKKGE